MKPIKQRKPDLLRDARKLAVLRLSVREYSGLEMRSFLERKKFPPEISAEIVQQLVDEKLLDDRRYAQSVTRAQSVRDKGPGYIQGKLEQKGVKIEIGEVRKLFEENSDRSELEFARDLLERRYPRALENEKEHRRATSALLRRGFSSEVVRKCLSEKEFSNENE